MDMIVEFCLLCRYTLTEIPSFEENYVVTR
jgi:hypothetical protein